MNDLVKLAPSILAFLGGPAGGIAGAGLQWLAGKFGAKDSTVDAIKEALNGTKPEDLIALKKLDLEFQQFCMDNAIKIDLAQISVNLEEAKSESLFVRGWRPATGWICNISFAYVALIEPLARFIATVGFDYAGAFPEIDTNLTLQVLLGMLGLAGLRSFDKTKTK
jgi:hypothetical protein